MTDRRIPRTLDALPLLFALMLGGMTPLVSASDRQHGPGHDTETRSTLAADAGTIARARAAGLPAVDPAARISGPFNGSEGTLYYLDRDGHVSYFHPEAATAYFGELNKDGSIRFRYGLNISGQYLFSTDGQAQQVRVLPDDVYRWPHAEAIAQVLIRQAQEILAGRAAAPAVDWAAASAASRSLHDTNMAILDGMRADACTEYYDGVYYLGCW